MTPQHLHEVVDYSVPLVRSSVVLVGGAMHLVHRLVRLLAGWLFLAEVLAPWVRADVREHFLGVAVVLDDDAEGLLDEVFVQVRRAEYDERARPVGVSLLGDLRRSSVLMSGWSRLVPAPARRRRRGL